MLHGGHDLIPLDLVEDIADALPNATLRVIEGLGHFAFAERPEIVIGEIEAFLHR